MNEPTHEDDRGIRDLFEDLRRHEGGRIPPFPSLWARAGAEASRRTGAPIARLWRIGLAGAGVIACAVLVALPILFPSSPGPLVSGHGENGNLEAHMLALSRWEAPTDVLLRRTPGIEILEDVLDLDASVLSFHNDAVRWDAAGEEEKPA